MLFLNVEAAERNFNPERCLYRLLVDIDFCPFSRIHSLFIYHSGAQAEYHQCCTFMPFVSFTSHLICYSDSLHLRVDHFKISGEASCILVAGIATDQWSCQKLFLNFIFKCIFFPSLLLKTNAFCLLLLALCTTCMSFEDSLVKEASPWRVN